LAGSSFTLNNASQMLKYVAWNGKAVCELWAEKDVERSGVVWLRKWAVVS